VANPPDLERNKLEKAPKIHDNLATRSLEGICLQMTLPKVWLAALVIDAEEII
jgi:hypothetical protein